MVVGVDHHCLTALYARTEVILDKVARSLLVVKYGTIVHHKAGAVHTAGQPRREWTL